MKENIEQKGETKQSFEEKQARLAKVGGINWIGDFEHRRSGWSASRNKAACLNAEIPITLRRNVLFGLKKKKKRACERPTTKAKGRQRVRKEMGKGNRFILLVWEAKNWTQKMKQYRRMK